jgi:DNA-binding PadR family transcriptional regulator
MFHSRGHFHRIFGRRAGRHGPFTGRGRDAMGGGRERMLGHGDLKLLVLSLIGQAPAHGYELIKAIEEQSAGAYVPSPGAIYPTLALLEDEGFAEAAADGGKKLYTITEAGRLFLEANAAGLAAIAEKLKPHEEPGSYFSAMRRIAATKHALKDVLKAKFRAGELDPARLEAIATILEKALDEIEKA